jgi:hypothetical protein
MKVRSPILTPPRVAALAAGLPILYVLIIGPERFYYESWGTWIVSPVIYTRISPSPLSEWLLRGFVHGPYLTFASYAAPVVLLFSAAVLALLSIGRDSLLLAFGSLALVTSVFTIYHFLQPLGMTYVVY